VRVMARRGLGGITQRGLDTAKQEVKHLSKGLKASCVSLLHLVHAGGGERA